MTTTLVLLSFALCFTAVSAGYVLGHYPEEEESQAGYDFGYQVNDPYTNDVKNQWERRVGDTVQGSYSLQEADGTVRIVDYQADSVNGFRAVVRKEGHAFLQPAASLLVHQQTAPAPRNYHGGTFVAEKNYGRGLGYL